MTKEEIDKAFDNRWRFKVEFSNMSVGYVKGVKALCHDFFSAGILIAQGPVCGDSVTAEFAGFEQWWNIYDKKRGREKCMKKWAKLSYEEKKACLVATPSYVASTPDKAFRKDPLTYLNGKCWNDEIIYHNATDAPTYQSRIDKLADILAG